MAGEDASPRQIRIAFLHPDLGLGGAERLIVDAAVELKRRGHRVHIFTAYHDKNRCFRETVDGTLKISVLQLPIPRHVFHKFHALFAYLRCIFVAFMIALCSPAFDVVIVDQVSAVIPILKLFTSSKVLFYCHFPDMLLATRNSWLRKLYRKPIDYLEETTTGMADRVVVNSDYTAAVFKSTFLTLAKQRINPSVLYPAVKTDDSAEDSPLLTERLAGVSEKKIILSINRFERKKNISLGIVAFSQLKQRLGSDAEEHVLVVAGGYDERLSENKNYLEDLKELVGEQGIQDSVLFITSMSDLEKLQLLRSCIFVVYTPEHEHFGIVPLEAMAAGKPVVACNSGGPMETIVNSATGFLCEPTPESFAVAMDVLASQPGVCQRMGAKARQHVNQNFSRSVFGDRLEQIVLDLKYG